MDEELVEAGEAETETETDVDAAALSVPPDLPVEVRKHMERQSRRLEKLQRELAQTRLEKLHGDQIAAAVSASGLPPEKWNEYADTLKTLIPGTQETTQTEVATEQEVEEAPSAAELALAAVAKGSDGPSSPSGRPTPEELLSIAKNDPAEYLRLKKAGNALERLPGSS